MSRSYKVCSKKRYPSSQFANALEDRREFFFCVSIHVKHCLLPLSSPSAVSVDSNPPPPSYNISLEAVYTMSPSLSLFPHTYTWGCNRIDTLSNHLKYVSKKVVRHYFLKKILKRGLFWKPTPFKLLLKRLIQNSNNMGSQITPQFWTGMLPKVVYQYMWIT